MKQPTQTNPYDAILETSRRVQWQLDEVLATDARLDATRPFLPDALVDADALAFLSPAERLQLNQIRGRSYTGLFGMMEDVILPFLETIAGDAVDDGPRARALLQFAGEEAKHTALFARFGALYERDLDVEHQVFEIAAPQRALLLSFHPLAVAFLTLHIEWMTQRHYVESVRDSAELEPLFANMLLQHWKEESQHVRIDQLLIDELAEPLTVEQSHKALGEYVLSVQAVSSMISVQVGYDLAAFERAIGRALPASERAALEKSQKRSFKRTYIGAGVSHPKFLAAVDAIAPGGRAVLDPLLRRA